MLAFLLVVFKTTAALNSISAPACKNVVADIRTGTISKLSPVDEHQAIIKAQPCYTSENLFGEANPNECMVGLFYDKNGFRFFTQAGYIEVNKEFTGTESVALLGKTIEQADKLINSEEIKTETVNDAVFVFYKTGYGCLVIKLKNDKVDSVYMCHKSADEFFACFLF